jgi:CRP-like cAMP-binding protein
MGDRWRIRRERVGRPSSAALRERRLFRDLPEQEIAALAAASTWHRVGEGEEVVRADEPALEDIVVVEGVVGIAATSPYGRDFVALIAVAEDLLVPPLPSASSDLPIHADALTSSVVVHRIRRSALDGCPDARVAVDEGLRIQVSRQLEEASVALMDFALFDVQTRFTRFLGRLAIRLDSRFLPLTHGELGRMNGLTRPQASRFLGGLRRLGLVSYGEKRRGITVLAPERLIAAQSLRYLTALG